MVIFSSIGVDYERNLTDANDCQVKPVTEESDTLLDVCDILLGDGICDDFCNRSKYEFDHGDCCLGLIEDTFCTECFCFEDCSYHERTNTSLFS